MRTSKKILSFFLAVVMVVTTCSVGFTAFAEEKNNSIWKTTGVDAESAFDTLDGLANLLPPLLMGIEGLQAFVADPVYEKYAKAQGKTADELTDAEKQEIAANATFEDILTCLQPTLLGLLNNTSREDFAKAFADEFPQYAAAASEPDGFSYLDENGQAATFYQLYTLCAKYKDEDSTIEKWYNALVEVAKVYPEAYAKYLAKVQKAEDIAAQINGKVIVPPGSTVSASELTYRDATLYDLKHFNFDFGSDESAVNEVIGWYNNKIEALGLPYTADDFADYVYYALGAGSELTKGYLVEYSNAITAAGSKVTYKGTANIYGLGNLDYDITDDITIGNYADVLKTATLAASGVNTAVDYLASGYDKDIEAAKQALDAAAAEFSRAEAVINDEYSNQLATMLANYTVAVNNAKGTTNKNNVAKRYFGSTAPDGKAVTAVGVKTYIDAGTVYMFTPIEGNSYINGLNYKYKTEIATVYNYPVYDKNTPVEGAVKPLSEYQADYDAAVLAKENAATSLNEEYANSYMEKCALDFYKNSIILNGVDVYDNASELIGDSSYYTDIIIGLAINNAGVTKAEIESLAASKMPNGSATCTLSAEEITAFGKILDDNKGYLTEKFWEKGSDTINGEKKTMPASLIGTAAAEYFGLVDMQRENITKLNDHRLGMYEAFKNNDSDAIAAYFSEAYEYALTLAVQELLNSLDTVNVEFAFSREYQLYDVLDINSFVDTKISILTAGVETGIDFSLTDEQRDMLYATGDYTGYYDLTGELGTLLLNDTLNSTIVDLVGQPLMGGQSIEDIVNSLLVTKVDLVTAIEDVWSRLVESPVGTLVELLPLLVVLVDELVLPMIANGTGDQWNDALKGVLTVVMPLYQLYAENGSYIGIDQIGWDLNELLPDLLHWLNDGPDADGIEYYNGGSDVTVTLKDVNTGSAAQKTASEINTADLKYYTVKDSQGNLVTRTDNADGTATYSYLNNTSDDLYEVLAAADEDETFTYDMTYEGNVPRLTGIYIADHALRDVRVSTLTSLISNALGSDLGVALGEIVTELVVLLTAAIDEFVNTPELRDAKRYDNSGNVTGSGLNNVFVALPQLFDIVENLAADKYGIDRDAWIYCYEGRLGTVEIDGKDGKVDSTANMLLTQFKSYAGSNDSNRKYDIFDTFAEILVENWLNALVSLFNNITTEGNEISDSLPIITGLLTSLGGFGEESIITDLLNSIFQITRESDYSFEFNNEYKDSIGENQFIGLKKDHAYFLITNITRLVEVIQNLIAHFTSSSEGGDDEGTALHSGASTFAASSGSPYYEAKPAKATSSKYSSDDLSNAKDLINNLDKMISSLLSDSSLNGFSLDSTENIISGVVSLLDRYLGGNINLSSETSTAIVRLVNQYLYFVTGESSNLTPNGKNVDPKKVYTNDALTGLVVETYALIEKLAGELLKGFSDGYDENTLTYNLLEEAIDGIISPDAISVRLNSTDRDYSDAQKKIAKYSSWTVMSEDSSRHQYKNLRIDWDFKDGDKEGFYDGLAASLRLVTSIIGVLLVDTGWYNTILTPVLGIFCNKNDIAITPYSELVADKNATGYYDKTLIAILTPVSGWLNAMLKAPASTLIKTIQGLAGFLDDNNTEVGTIKSVLDGVLAPVANELNGLAHIFEIESDKLGATSPTLAGIINELAAGLPELLDTKTILSGLDVDMELSGANIIPLVNTLLSGLGVEFKQISWSKLYNESTEGALVYFVEYLFENLLDSGILKLIAGLIGNDTVTMLFELISSGDITAKDVLKLLNNILEISDSPTLAYWTFAQYLQEMTENFKYPAGITKAMANQGVTDLDNLVKNIFPLLASFGVNLGGDNLKAIVDKNLFTNEILTKLAVALYGALDGLDPTIKQVFGALGIVTSTKDVAKLLTDKSYGATFTSAANTIKAQSSWKNVKNVNWGFTNGSAKAQQGFVNALVAILRPLNNVLNVFLNEGSLPINEVASKLINSINVSATTVEYTIAEGMSGKLVYSMKNGVLTLTIQGTTHNSTKSTIKLDFRSLKDLKDLKIEGTNAYNSAIIPLLEVFQCSGIKTYSQYRSDVAKAKDNLLLDVLNPLVGSSSSSFLNKVLANPFKELTTALPNIAMFLDGNGLIQIIDNILAPITYALADGKNISAEASDLIEMLLGAPIQDLIIPLVNGILESNGINIEIPEIDWTFLASLGEAGTYTSKATDLNGNYLTGKIVKNVDNGKVLVTVLRYIAKILVNNASEIKNLICGIDAVKKNDIIVSIIKSVFNTISTAAPDQIVAAVFYLLDGEPENAFWDYTKYKTGKYEFSYPEGMDVDFLKNLPPMLDGLIGGLIDLNETIGKALFKDELISKLATGLYGAIEGVKINDNMNLTQLLAQTDIDFSTANVAKLLVDEKYGQKFESASATIKAAGSWKNVNVNSLKWGVTDRDSFFHALVAVLRPLYGVLDVLLNDASLGLFDLVHIPGSNGYTSSIVPLMEAFSLYNVKTQYQYRQDINKEYDAILLDIINPIWDLVEDVLNAPLQTIAAIVPNLALFIGNDGLCQVIDNLLTPISALADAIRPVVDLNDLLDTLFKALKFDLNSLLGKIGVKNFKLDVYNLKGTLKPILGGDAIIPLLNAVLGMIDIKGTKLGLKLNPVDWLQLASHGETIVSASQAATFGSRIFVKGDSSETLIAVLRYLVNTINTGDNYKMIGDLIAGLLGDSVDDTISGVINEVMGMLQGDTDEVIAALVDLLQTLGS